ncbi:MAG: hypothetical protein RLZZ301_1118 [Bacteroidota bacterium]|jgi:hypothetical protein
MEFRILKQIVWLVGLALSLQACTKEVHIEIPGYQNQLVVDGSIETGMPAIVLLSRSNNVYDATNYQAYLNSFVDDAVVVLSNGSQTDTLQKICTDALPPGLETYAAALFGLPVEIITTLHLCAYVSMNMVGEVGKTYSLKIEHQGKTYQASSTIAQPVALDSLYWKPEGNFTDRGYSWAKLSDPANTTDAYCWQVKYLSEPGFSKTFNPYFNDNFFNGLTFEFAYENPMSFKDTTAQNPYRGYFKQHDTLVVKFSRIGKKEYNFFEKKYNQLYSGGSPFAVPTNIPTNITGGALGVWVAYSPFQDTLICQ